MARESGTSSLSIMTFHPSPFLAGQEGDEEQAPAKKLRAAAYCRVSSDSEEQLTSYLQQVRYYTQYLDTQEDYVNCGIYTDEGITGTSIKKRTGFQQMMQACRDGKLDLIITKSVSRFGRNTVDCLVSVRELQALGVDVLFEKENIHSLGSGSELLLTLIAAVAESESFQMSENIKWGFRRKFETGSVKSLSIGKCLGYRKDEDGSIVVVEEEAVIVRRIYREFLDGLSPTRIAEGLEKDCVRTDQGNEIWSVSTISRILRNELVKGDILFQKTYVLDPLTQKRMKNKGELPKYYLEGSHQGIVDRDTWACVQLELERQDAFCQEHHFWRYHHHTEENSLSSRITCSVCGSTYIMLRPKKEENKAQAYWRCRSFLGEHGKPIEGKTFTPPPMPLRNKGPVSRDTARQREKRRKLPIPRQMVCTDIQVPAEDADKAFMRAWNFLVSHGLRYASSFREMVREGENELIRYRARKMILLLDRGRIRKLDYGLMNKVLDHIEVTAEGKLAVIFLTGTRVTV